MVGETKPIGQLADLPLHPACAASPPMAPEHYAALKDDIAKHGIVFPLTVHKGLLLDGRHRLKACEELGIEPEFVTDDELLDHDGDPWAFVWSTMQHKHPTDGELAMFAAEWQQTLKPAARERQKAGKGADGSGGRGKKKNPVETVPQGLCETPDSNKSRDQAGEKFGVSGRTVAKAAKVIAKGCPQLQEAVRSGRVNVSLAEKVAKTLDAGEQEEVVAVAMLDPKPEQKLREAVNSTKPAAPPTSGMRRVGRVALKDFRSALDVLRITGSVEEHLSVIGNAIEAAGKEDHPRPGVNPNRNVKPDPTGCCPVERVQLAFKALSPEQKQEVRQYVNTDPQVVYGKLHPDPFMHAKGCAIDAEVSLHALIKHSPPKASSEWFLGKGCEMQNSLRYTLRGVKTLADECLAGLETEAWYKSCDPDAGEWHPVIGRAVNCMRKAEDAIKELDVHIGQDDNLTPLAGVPDDQVFSLFEEVRDVYDAAGRDVETLTAEMERRDPEYADDDTEGAQ